MSTMNIIQAVRSALEVMLERDPNVCVFGEDVGYFGGVFRATEGLQKKFGPGRIFDTPLAEGGIIGVAIGMSINGLRPVPEIQFSDYMYPAFDQITNELAKLRYRSGGEWAAPMTIRAPSGGGIRGGLYHSQSPEAYYTHTPGLCVVMPCNPHDAKGLLISSIECDDPVVFLEPKRLYRGVFDGDPTKVTPWREQPEADVPDEHYRTPLGRANIVRPGEEITVVAWGTMVHVARAAIEQMQVDAELIDLRTLVPLDLESITSSVEKTGRCVIVHEAPRTCGFGAEVAALVQEHCFWSLEAPVLRVTGWDTPFPHGQEWEYMPSRERVAGAMRSVLAA
ncbi:MAG TPA: alpha-ketoacid dehydrogenase subunit beta [Lacipirellulaceae bacterium]|jgi:2-oxoisovalerate dehydrogenase E1 component beta subunit|nr:alpha-ketoacid dehydrogenase subunit beta [Lacipirellulaceae bacterium]